MSALHQRIEPRELRDVKRTTQRRYRHHAKGGVAIELTIKLLVNSLLSLAALAALVKLLPFHLSQQAKLREISIEVGQTEQRVQHLRDNFNRNFDPQEATKIMQEQNPRVDPHQLRVVWLNKQAPDKENLNY
jgi:hypothetical protein